MIQCWRLDDSRQTLVLGSTRDRLAEVVYWGARLPDNEDLTTLYEAHAIDVTGGMLDSNPAISVCPEVADSFPGQPGLHARALDGTVLRPEFRLVKEDVVENRIHLTYSDQTGGLSYYSFAIEIDPETHVLKLSAALGAEGPFVLDWLAAPVLPAPQLSDEMIDVSGRWIGEFALNRAHWSPGIRMRESRTGRSGHEHFPGLIVPGRGATNTAGEVWGFHYGWSGGHRMVAEELPDGRRQVQFGHAAGTETAPSRAFETAPLYATYSPEGLNGCATAFQRHLRDRVVKWPGPKPRPVHYNCWEAVYFRHNLGELKDIATRAAALGAERFVLDDGWFEGRNDDTTSLGDWWVDAGKYPQGLTPLIEHVHALGMGFGLWFEPEMVNRKSQLARTHPNWLLGPESQISGRQQYVLDMSNEDVCAYLFEKIDSLLADNAIEYIKWDHNRVLPMPDADQTRGTYALLDRLREAHPDVEIESCASGGGRIDFGILSRTHRVWLSDSNDALERLKIQHNAALFLPMAVTGSHVGPLVCHTSGRVLDIRFRAWVAAQRHMGFEMDPRELTEEEGEVLRQVTLWWKANREWLLRADILRLDSADPSVIAEQHLSEDGSQFVVFAGQAGTSVQIAPRPLRLTRLSPDVMYEVELKNREDAGHLSRGVPALKQGAIRVSGAYLMTHGLVLPWSFPERMWVVEGRRL